MSEIRTFSTAVIASLSSGVLLCKIGDLHEAAEFLLGHPIWTHHFASEKLWKAMQVAVIQQHPHMPIEVVGVTPENYREKVEELEARLGPFVAIRKRDWRNSNEPRLRAYRQASQPLCRPVSVHSDFLRTVALTGDLPPDGPRKLLAAALHMDRLERALDEIVQDAQTDAALVEQARKRGGKS
jgi:hypothetical protein